MSDKEHDFGSLVCIYAQILPRIRAAAKGLGYAIAIHGTLTRDLDLLAVPWTEEADEPLVLVNTIANHVGGYVIGDRVDERGYISDHPTEQPHGRLSWNICWGGKVFIDLSVMPRINTEERDRLRGVMAAVLQLMPHIDDKGMIGESDYERAVLQLKSAIAEAGLEGK